MMWKSTKKKVNALACGTSAAMMNENVLVEDKHAVE